MMRGIMIFESRLPRMVLSQSILHYGKGFVLNFLEKRKIGKGKNAMILNLRNKTGLPTLKLRI